jgi:glutamate-5-semialdehyde dehydrogenase
MMNPNEPYDLERSVDRARDAARRMTTLSRAVKDDALRRAADGLLAAEATLREANARDLAEGAAKGLSAALLDRLRLTAARIRQMAEGLEQVATLPDPVGETIRAWRRPNGLEIARVRVPIGVVLVIYESRPNVTADAAALCLKSGNAVILRGGSESLHSNIAIATVLEHAFAAAGIPEGAVELVRNPDRALVAKLLRMDDRIDLVVPRGGAGLIRAVVEGSSIPVVKHDKGVCHVFVDRAADPHMARDIVVNAKCQRPGTCNALETLLVDAPVAATLWPDLAAALLAEGVELRGCPRALAALESAMGAPPERVRPATVEDWDEEYLDLVLAVRVVDGLDEALGHIARHGSGHSEAIVTRDWDRARRFQAAVDAAAVYVNASTRFTDGFEFGMGAEIGISTNKLHARGPMGLEELTTYKYLVSGDGQVRG